MPHCMTKPGHNPRSTILDLRPSILDPLAATLYPLILALTLFSLPTAHAQAPDFIRGGDLSSLYRLEQAGAVFKHDGQPAPALEILRDAGMNLVRLRLWHTPAGGVNGLEETLATARLVSDAGLSLLLDFHYTDSWADPGKQPTPAAWRGLAFEVLLDSVEQYTHDVIAAFKAQGTLPEMVQLGNEITSGMLWPSGQLYAPGADPAEEWNRFGQLLKAARAGLERALEPNESVEVMLHIDRGGSYSDTQWFFDHIIAQGVEFDVIGLSFYPWWHGSLSALRTTLNGAARRFNKDIVVVEMAYPFTLQWNDDNHNKVGEPEHVLSGYPASPTGQDSYLGELRRIVEAVPEGRGRGFVYWEPAWIAWPGSSGSSWENVALFDFSGELTPGAATLFRESTTDVDHTPVLLFHELRHHVFPVPADDLAILRLMIDRPTTLQIEVVNVLGRRVHETRSYSLSPGAHEISLDVRALAPGIYFYQIIPASGSISTGSFIVR